jgi:hypothetical protein
LTWIRRSNQRLVQAPLHNVRAYSRDMLGLERDRLSRAVHASLPISKLVKQRSDFLNSTASSAARPRRREAGFYSASFPSSTPFFAFRFAAISAGSRQREAGSTPPRFPPSTTFLPLAFQRSAPGSSASGGGVIGPSPTLVNT